VLKTKFDESGKLDYPVCYFGTFSFDNFIVKLRKKLDLKI
jgi:hypothetical protein